MAEYNQLKKSFEILIKKEEKQKEHHESQRKLEDKNETNNSQKNISRKKKAKEHKKEEAELKVWMKILSIKDLYDNIGNILHLALCCFVKVPLEATAESIGSVINQHGCKERASILPSTLSIEV